MTDVPRPTRDGGVSSTPHHEARREPPVPRPSQQDDAMRGARVDGCAVVTRQYDVGYEIQLGSALAGLAGGSAAARSAPTRTEAQAIRIPNPPVTVSLGREDLAVDGRTLTAELSARIYDFAVVSLRARIPFPRDLPWATFVELGGSGDLPARLGPVFDRHRDELLARIGPCVERPFLAGETEDYTVFRIDALRDRAGGPLPPAALRDEEVAPLLLGERRPLSESARRELLPHRFSYYADDLTILTWNNALVVEPSPDDHDIEYVLEFANAQLLELRVYDGLLDRELPKLYDRAARVRHGRYLGRRFSPLLSDIQRVMADITETVERSENALKVTDDVYLARIYATALELFRWSAFRRGVDRKLAILRETYEMLNGQSQAARAEVLEATIVALILVEIVLGLLRR